MNLQEGLKKIEEHPDIPLFIFGLIAEDGNYRLDAAACLSQADLEKERERFMACRIWKMEEIKKQK